MHRLIRPLVHVYWRATRGLTLGVRGVVLASDGAVLLVRHTYTKGWHLPGGGVERGETAGAALVREIREEAEVAVTGPLQLHGVYYNRKVGKRDHVLVFLVRAFEVLGAKARDREIAEARFFPPDSLPDGATGPTRRRIAEVLAGGADLPEAW